MFTHASDSHHPSSPAKKETATSSPHVRLLSPIVAEEVPLRTGYTSHRYSTMVLQWSLFSLEFLIPSFQRKSALCDFELTFSVLRYAFLIMF